jgi:hypothetical protein
VRGSLAAGVSTDVRQRFSDRVRLDLIPGLEAGVRSLGVARVGINSTLLIPLVGGPVGERTIRIAGGVGVSMDF